MAKAREALREELVARLKRIEGQARGIQRMINEGRGCEEIIIQLAALKEAVNQVGLSLLGDHMAQCIEEELSQGRGTPQALERFMRLFTKFG